MPNAEVPEVTDLVELERGRERLRGRLRWRHLFLPASGDDLKAYRSLLRFVKPYRVKLATSVGLAMAAALFLGLEIALLQGALGKILGAPIKPPSTAVAPVLHGWEAKRDAAEQWLAQAAGIPAPSDDPVVERGRREKLLWLLAALLVVAVGAAGVASYGSAVLMTGVSRRVVRDIRAHLLRHVIHLSVRFHQRNHSAQLATRITSDLESFGRFLTEATVRFIQDFFDFLSMLVFVAINQGAFIFVIAVVIALAIAPVTAISRKLRKGDRKSHAGLSELSTDVSEMLVGQRVVKAFTSEEHVLRRFHTSARAQLKKQMRVRRLRSLTEPIVMTIGGLGVAAIIVLGGRRVLDGRLDATGLLVNVLALVRAMGGLRGMSKQMNDFQLGLAAADRVGTLLSSRSEIREKPDARPLPPFSREIRFEHVEFRHEAHKPTLHAIDLVIRKGEKVALVGPSGAGKSTFIDLLPRFFDVDGGRITIDGHDVRDVTLRSLREQIGIVSQETILFRDSIRDNIRFGRPDATDAEVIAAAKAANAHGFIARKRRRYDTRIGERGVQLSGGERQRLAIARALLRDPPILILDEATSALDSESERVVQAALQRLMHGRTVIVIAHRLATIRDADRIVVLAGGRIAEDGRHEELMAKPGGLYRRHYELQTRARPVTEHAAES